MLGLQIRLQTKSFPAIRGEFAGLDNAYHINNLKGVLNTNTLLLLSNFYPLLLSVTYHEKILQTADCMINYHLGFLITIKRGFTL